MSSLDDLQQILQNLDPDGVLKSIAYDKTFNTSLGFTDDPADFHVGIPYNPWPAKVSDAPAEPKSTLAKAFEEVLQKGLEGSSGREGKIVIDIAHLNGGWREFWGEKNGQPPTKGTVAYTLAETVNKVSEDTVPVVRLLLGNHQQNPASKTWPDLKHELQLLFWPNGKPLFNHPKLEFSVGSYNPNFNAVLDRGAVSAAGTLEPLLQVARDMVDNLYEAIRGTSVPGLDEMHNKFLAKFKEEEVIKRLFERTVPNVSWNHAKILAVNGQTLLTGGANFWNEYADSEADISDIHVKVKGDAAISAHTYCDYFWRYLNKPHKTDSFSWRRTARKKRGNLEWDSEDDPVDVLPFNRTPGTASGKALLSVAKLGDWFGPMQSIEYPIQLIDAIRDIVLNVGWRLLWAQKGKSYISGFKGWFMEPLADTALLPSFRKAKITPTAWASRIARTAVIQKAKETVYIDIQTIAGYDQFNDGQWTKGRDEINKALKLKGDSAWNGVLWPYDFINAVANFMDNVQVGNGHGVFILLPTDGSGNHRGYEDAVAANEFKQRVRWMLGSIPVGQTNEEYDRWWSDRCKMKRINFGRTQYNHCKVICADKKLLYVGSDNLYPNYNEEYGVWIDDRPAIDAWYEKFWTPRWTTATDATMDLRAGRSEFGPTMIDYQD